MVERYWCHGTKVLLLVLLVLPVLSLEQSFFVFDSVANLANNPHAINMNTHETSAASLGYRRCS